MFLSLPSWTPNERRERSTKLNIQMVMMMLAQAG
jgi:hypothetical protein